MPLPRPDVAWIDPATGKPTQVFAQYLSALDKQSNGLVNANATISAGYPLGLDNCVRIASPGTPKTYLLVYGGEMGGNGMWLWSTLRSRFEFTPVFGAYETIDTTNCSIDGVANQALVAGTRYYVYAGAPASYPGFIAVDHSTTVPTTGGDPLGDPRCPGYDYKNDGTRNWRLIGAVQSDASGVIWRAGTRGVFFSGIASHHQRQRLNYQCKIAGGNSSAAWQEINSTQFITAFLWGDGAEPDCVLTGSVRSDTAGASVFIGISMNNENPPYDFTEVTCDTANVNYGFAVNASSGDFADENVRFGVWMKNSSGAGTITNGTLTLNLNQ